VTSLSAQRQQLRDDAYRFAMDEVLPVANELDPQKADIPRELIAKMGERRYFGILIPPEYDGLGLGIFEYCLVSEELTRAWMSVASVIARGNGLAAWSMTDDEREELLPKMARGEFIGAFALSEPGAGSDVAGVACRADRDGDDWVINGEKMWVGWAKAADFMVLFARTSPMDPKQRQAGITPFFFRKERDAFPPGIEARLVDKIGYHGMSSWHLTFTDFRIAARERVPRGEGTGFRTAVTGLNTARIHTAARACGAAQGALDVAMDYAKQRVQFGRPIADFQAIRFKVADMATQTEVARRMWHSVADAVDAGGLHDLEASMAKLFASEMAEHVTSEAMQILGGVGYTTMYAVERHWRDARLTKIFEGTSEIQKRIISDRLLGKAGR
jgi:alkylation response protein AidB-like acyl-CoA dehydrogenase